MAEFEVLVEGWIRVTRRFRVRDVPDSDAGANKTLQAVKAEKPPWTGFKLDLLARPRNVAVVKITPLNRESAAAEHAAKQAEEEAS